MLKIAILVESNDSNPVRQLYQEEKEYHGNDAGAICCLKVSILNSYWNLSFMFSILYLRFQTFQNTLDPESFVHIIELLNDPTMTAKLKMYITNIISKTIFVLVRRCNSGKGEYIVTREEKL